MKTLFILRHAEAAPASSSDFERTLTARGMAQAEALGARMKEKNYAPALALCSSATRTRQTLEGILKTIAIPTIEHTRDIYHAETQDLMDILRGLDEKYASVLLVGHNPAIHHLAASLAVDAAELAYGYPPATLAALKISAPWKNLTAQEQILIDVLKS